MGSSFLRLLFLCLVLASCGKSIVTAPRYDMPENPGGRLCVNQCREARNYCREKCDLSQRRCTTHMQTQAIKDYESYAAEQFRNRMPLDLRPSDFERPEKCLPTACHDDCDGVYQMCFVNCGGKVVATNSCRYFCF